MKARWITLGAVGFAVWLIATFAVVYAAVELAEDDSQTQAIVTGHRIEIEAGVTAFCVEFTLLGKDDRVCNVGSSSCLSDAEIGKRLPDSCLFSNIE